MKPLRVCVLLLLGLALGSKTAGDDGSLVTTESRELGKETTTTTLAAGKDCYSEHTEIHGPGYTSYSSFRINSTNPQDIRKAVEQRVHDEKQKSQLLEKVGGGAV